MSAEVQHDPTHYSSRFGCWATCSCGWRSETWRAVVGAELEFGRHLVDMQGAAPWAAYASFPDTT